MDSALELLATPGASFTVRAVCRGANLHERYLYQCFNSTQELMAAVYDQVLEEFLSSTSAALAEVSTGLRTRLVAAAHHTIESLNRDPCKLQLLTHQMFSGPFLLSRRERITTYVAQLFGESVTAKAPRLESGYAALQIEAISAAVTGVILSWANGRLPVSAKELVDHISRFVQEVVLVRAPEPTTPED